jgi:hypothetical protein
MVIPDHRRVRHSAQLVRSAEASPVARRILECRVLHFGTELRVKAWVRTDPETRYESYGVSVSGGTGPYHIQWSNGATGPNATYSFGRGNYLYYVTATITDLGSGVTPLQVRRPVYVIDRCDETDSPYVDECQ